MEAIMSILLRCAILLACGTCAVSGADEYIDNEYMVVVDDTLTDATDAEFTEILENDYELTVFQVDHFTTFRVFCVRGEAADADRAALLPEVIMVEQNAVVQLAILGPSCTCDIVPAPRTWGLDRVDQRDKLVSSNELNPGAEYLVGPYRGAGVVAYVVDTGIDGSHPQFGGRASCLHAAPSLGVPCQDDHGHGTHVAGTIGSATYGVAKDVTLVGVKSFNAFGYGVTDSVCNGLAWVLQHHNSRTSAKSVVNMSFGSSSNMIPVLVSALLEAGVTAVAAAGNNDGPACDISPANVPGAITVGATTVDDTSSVFRFPQATNWGPCVDLFAPGPDVMSTWPGNRIKAISGTSMSAPHVTGAVAIEMSRRSAPTAPATIHDYIVSGATPDKITFSTPQHATSPNRLLFIPCCCISKKSVCR